MVPVDFFNFIFAFIVSQAFSILYIAMQTKCDESRS